MKKESARPLSCLSPKRERHGGRDRSYIFCHFQRHTRLSVLKNVVILRLKKRKRNGYEQRYTGIHTGT